MEVTGSSFDNLTTDTDYGIFTSLSGSAHKFIDNKFSNLNNAPFNIGINAVNIIGCNFTNITVSQNAPIIVKNNYVSIVDCIFTNTTGTVNGAITVQGDFKTRIRDNTYNTGLSLPNVTEGIEDFTLYNFFYVTPNGTGNGQSKTSDYANLTWALNNILDYGTIYLKKGIYELNSQKKIHCNIIGIEDNVIINKGSFYQDSISLTIDNIFFNNTQYSFYINQASTLTNCIFNGTNIKDLFSTESSQGFNQFKSNLTFINCDFKGTSVIYCCEHSQTYNISFEDCRNINYIFIRANDQNNDVFVDNVTVLDSTFNVFAIPGNSQNAKWVLNNINLINNTIRGTDGYHLIYGDRYSSKSSLVNWTLSGNVFTPTKDLFKYYDGLTLYGLHINDLNAKSINIINPNTIFTLRNSSFENISVASIISQNMVHALDNVSITNSSLSYIANSFSSVNKLTVDNVNFTNNVIFNLPASASVSNSKFTTFKGHITVNGDNVEFTNTSFKNGNNSDLNGSAVVVTGSYISFTDCNFINNNGSNGAVYFVKGSLRPSFTDCNFTNNIAKEKAGAIYFDNYESVGIVITVEGITESTISDWNGSIYNGVYGNLTQTSNVVYVINDTKGKSGADADAKSPNTPGTFDTAYSIAGKNCIFYFVESGNIFDHSMDVMRTLDYGWKFIGNNTTFVGLRFQVTKGDLKVYNITFKENNEDSVVIVDDENVLFDNCTFLNNGGNKISYGGAIQINADNVNITHCTFINNTAEDYNAGYGGALYINASYVVISNNTFDHNSAYKTGSHIYI